MELKGVVGASKYQVSSCGRIFSKKNMNELCQYGEVGGYRRSTITFDTGKRKPMLVHRMVAMAFIPNPENKAEVNHMDGDKTNNKLSNLEWTTRSENLKHSFKLGLMNS